MMGIWPATTPLNVCKAKLGCDSVLYNLYLFSFPTSFCAESVARSDRLQLAIPPRQWNFLLVVLCTR